MVESALGLANIPANPTMTIIRLWNIKNHKIFSIVIAPQIAFIKFSHFATFRPRLLFIRRASYHNSLANLTSRYLHTLVLDIGRITQIA